MLLNQIGGEIPDFAAEYVNKYGNSNFLKLMFAHWGLCDTSTQPISAKVQDVLKEKNDPNTMSKRFGGYLSAFCKGLERNGLALGDILEHDHKKEIVYGGVNKFQTMKNYKIAPWMLKTGEVHVSIGCVDFAQLLFATLEGEDDDCIKFYGIDSSMVSITKCKLLHQMMLDNAAARSILQVWFSSAWSDQTLKDFLKSCEALLQRDGLLSTEELKLVKVWISNDISMKTASTEWMKGLAGTVVKPFEPCANFRHEIDRVDFARYLFTGFIFEEDERGLSCGNRTMFCFPKCVGATKVEGNSIRF